MATKTIHFAMKVKKDGEDYMELPCAKESERYRKGYEPICTLYPKEVTCGLCRRTHEFKEALARLELAVQDEPTSNVINLFQNRPIDSILQNLNQWHSQRKIKSISVAYTFNEESSGICETHIEAVTDATSIIGMLEYNKTTVIEILKRSIETK